MNTKVFEFTTKPYNHVVFPTDTEDPYFLYDDIYDKYSKTDNGKITVLLDLFMRNGYSFNRYILLTFEQKDKVRPMIVNPSDIPDEIKQSVMQFISNNIDMLEYSALPKNVIEFIKLINKKDF